MSIHKLASSQEKDTYIFPSTKKEEFVLQAIQARTECFVWYDNQILQNLFDKSYDSQIEFDSFMDNIIHQDLKYYFDTNIEVYDTNPFYIDTIKNNIQAMIDTFGWNLSGFKDKILENANAIATSVIQSDFDGEIKELTTTMVNTIIQKIPSCIVSKKNQQQVIQYLSKTQLPSTLFTQPNMFAASLPFANIYEQAAVVHIIHTEYQKFHILVEAKKQKFHDSIDPKQIDPELFEKVYSLQKMFLDRKWRIQKSLLTLVMSYLYRQVVADCMTSRYPWTTVAKA